MPAQVFCQEVSERAGDTRDTQCRRKSHRQGDCFVEICFFFPLGWYLSALDNVFLAIYFMEIVLKLYALRSYFFKTGWNIMGMHAWLRHDLNSTSPFPSGARREEIEITLVSYSKLQTFHAISVKGLKGIYRSWFQVSSQVTKSWLGVDTDAYKWHSSTFTFRCLSFLAPV